MTRKRKFLIAGLIIVIALLIGGTALYVLTVKRLLMPPTQSPTSKRQGYKNPFQKPQYENPFSEYQNPFEKLK